MPGRALCLLCSLVMPATFLCADLLPRVTFLRGDPRRTLTSFSQDGTFHYDTFLLSEDEGTLYVGARDTILSLRVDSAGSMELTGSIVWQPMPEKKQECVFKKKSNLTECFNFIRVLVPVNQTHLYTCGTYAFSPTCSYINLENFSLVSVSQGRPLLQDGKGQCPFDPSHKYTAILVGGELYTGTMNNFQGNEPIISRALSSRTLLKTDAFLRWLNVDAGFVASANIPGDEKVYFFFQETAEEFDFFEKLMVSRVARVCKNDVGGEKVLQKKWTTFLKAQLMCFQPGHFPFNVIHHSFVLPQPGGGAVFYGVFTSQWQMGDAGSTAVCAFNLEDIESVFNGKYKELNKESSRWMTYSDAVPEPRPGSCSVRPSADKVLTFMKNHFLMDGKVVPRNKQPVLVKQNVKYTRIAVDQTHSVSGTSYEVMFLGTDQGFLHKAVALASGAHIIEEIQLFKDPEPVQNLLFSPGKGILYVGYSKGVLQVPLANCSVYRSCADCVLARDPYCAWHGRSQSCQETRATNKNTSDWLQDIETGRPGATCQQIGGKGRATPRSRDDSGSSLVKTLSPALNSVIRLPCPQLSALADYTWSYPGPKTPAGLTVLDDKTLVIIMQRQAAGEYTCWASENGHHQPVARYVVRDPTGGDGYPNILSESGGDSTVGEGLERGAGPQGGHRSYWTQFVAVTVLLLVTLVVAMAVAAFSYHSRLKAKSKVQGCNTPEATKVSSQEKVPLNGGRSPQLQGPFQERAKDPRDCCVQMEGLYQDIDADNNRLSASLGARQGSQGVALEKA
ncbi:semaphorin-4A isoform X2 [Chelonia mydas]|uniref:semaphorin-4A isoform X2 n=1 Tax=Chelonia mydas TaxID=8469 RepID=UPI0018A20CD9|nr:semaphorin-4A isoform X2 [Chelonia mydas]XP_037738851.1 semaphorin-4A isoform X2 [Chelonia mydas]XP_037738852.1 semaphorin-4A isoform X2 [Chelonia mydas]XP_043391321.1 semaphorin-4A isoform X2 [Chelonia mydas]XP_043391322.1 semaphorin-4A isoform X2 [Chelonia mydas]XP_043391323.1 semaphorin-4A isoform X2 [Chelonia mydas]XP_043391324.1 semaphorin-4A isoform X2 [Chelonia mydas]XP_043391325.1 semaphorin-4A isoform X2 [Chelonia mydas]XP_043391326.1 semaphorin-4A isoform X2 [Chelonia mydas]XP